jgi:hypothetical protein
MLNKKSNRIYFISLFILSVIFILVFSEVKIPNSIHTYFEVNPTQKWVLSKGAAGQISSNIIDYKSVVSNNLTVVQFDRGESMNFRLVHSILSNSHLNKGDTVGIINSSELQERITKLEGELLVAKADLTAKSTGQKQALIDEAKNKIRFTEAGIEAKTLLFNRAKEMYKKNYLSKEEFETSLWELRQLKIQNEIHKAQLEVLTTGSKSEELQVLKSAIDSYINEIKLLKDRLNDFVLTAPISGEIIREVSQDTLLIVNNTSQLILTAPIRYEHIQGLSEGQSVRLDLNSAFGEMTGTLVAVSREVKHLNGVQILFCRVLLPSPHAQLVPGLLIQGDIILPNITIRNFLFSLFRS